mmetsp:Transcript_21462/g.44063  ORF Transcript_21462/g.44063 Transcript_21462/m.44063 type:complete len:244 (+) Transcript_21462:370-1101(+)
MYPLFPCRLSLGVCGRSPSPMDPAISLPRAMDWRVVVADSSAIPSSLRLFFPDMESILIKFLKQTSSSSSSQTSSVSPTPLLPAALPSLSPFPFLTGPTLPGHQYGPSTPSSSHLLLAYTIASQISSFRNLLTPLIRFLEQKDRRSSSLISGMEKWAMERRWVYFFLLAVVVLSTGLVGVAVRRTSERYLLKITWLGRLGVVWMAVLVVWSVVLGGEGACRRWLLGFWSTSSCSSPLPCSVSS